ncbi:hypothetical protein [Mangrovibacillus cuniculi]|uniref:Uncharacterized protein n=1 Tax=Mangrovibacillus cuniculi TaxID=2593652 RepID=A0A7S8CCW1_9BACI|nr:hypothetical protein [Mangrovibacillus cuniculi]QPC47669.1 hypothetical protein G8O30_12245 [Mangrovibacillus cuniculi]
MRQSSVLIKVKSIIHLNEQPTRQSHKLSFFGFKTENDLCLQPTSAIHHLKPLDFINDSLYEIHINESAYIMLDIEYNFEFYQLILSINMHSRKIELKPMKHANSRVPEQLLNMIMSSFTVSSERSMASF